MPTQWAKAWVSPASQQQIPQDTCSTRQVSLETQNLGSHAAGKVVAQLDLTRTQLSCREYFNVLSLLF